MSVVFGIEDPKDQPCSPSGEEIIVLNKKNFDDMINIYISSPLNVLTGGLIDRHNLHPLKRRLNKNRKKIKHILKEEFKKRKNVRK